MLIPVFFCFPITVFAILRFAEFGFFGEGHNLQMHSAILVKPAKVKDLIGINHVAIRGKLDLLGVAKRRTTRSAYGVKRG
jgi:ribosomal protein S12